jgi:hypothetical protein
MRKEIKVTFMGLLLLFVGRGVIKAAPGDDNPLWLQQAANIKVPAYDKTVSAVVLVDDSTTTVEADGRSTKVYNFAVRVLQKEGRDYAAGSVGYIPNVGKVKDFRAWLIRPGGETKRYGKEETLDVASDMNDVYNEYRRKRISGASEAEVGSVFAYTFTLEDRSVFSQDDNFFQNEIPVINSRYTLVLPAGWRAEAITFNHPNIEPQVTGSTYVWELTNLPPIADEPFSPHPRNLAAHLAVSYYPPTTGPAVPIKTFTNWTEVATWMSELEDPQVQVDDALSRKAYELTALAKTEYEKIQAIAQYVQNIRYISIQIGVGRGGGYRPHSSTEVFNKSYGDCKDKANLMRAMLKVVGIDSIPVSIHSGDDPNYVRSSWPSPIQFNHCIIAVKVSDQTQASTIIKHPTLGRLMIFDPTDSETQIGDLPYYLQGSLALLDTKQSTDLVTMPITPPEMNQLERSGSFQLSSDGTLTGKIQEQANGQAASIYRTDFKRLSKPEYNALVERRISSGVTAARVSKIEPSDNAKNSKFTLDVEFAAPAYGQLMQNRLLVFRPAVVSRREGTSFAATERKHPVVLRAAAFSETVTVQLPAGFAIDEVPDPVKLVTSFGTYNTSYEVKGSELVFKRQLSQQAATIPAADYGMVKKFFENIRAAENAPVVLAKN